MELLLLITRLAIYNVFSSIVYHLVHTSLQPTETILWRLIDFAIYVEELLFSQGS